MTITLPAAGDRYLSLALMDAYTNNFAILGTRTTGPDGGTFRLVGPREAAEGWNVIRAPTNHVWALARILVDGPHDLEAAREVQARDLHAGPGVASRPGPTPTAAPTGAEYFASAAALMAANPPPVTDLALLRDASRRWACSTASTPARFSADEAAEIEAGVAEARKAVRGAADWAALRSSSGWSYPSARLGDFDQDYGYRAAVALSGLAALPPAEAMYMRPRGPCRGDLLRRDQGLAAALPGRRAVCRSTPSGRSASTRRPTTGSSSSPTTRWTATPSATARRA